MIEQPEDRMAEFGAAGRLLATGELSEVLPLDDAGLLDDANPVTPDGRVALDKGRLRARQDAQVRLASKGGGVSLIVLGGSHDLSQSVRRLGHGRCEYVRVTTTRFTQVSAK
jgi:hypothetical protein